MSILLPSISADLGTPVATLQWAVTGYLLVGAAVIVTSGAMGDVFGRRRMFQVGLVLFVISCVLIGLAGTGLQVILGRLIQGAAGSTILACGLSLLSVTSSGNTQVKAVALWGAAAAAGAAAGPVVGGVLNEVAGWQGLFWIDAAIAVVCILVTLAKVPESRDPNRPRTIDLLGTVQVAAALVPFVFAMTEGSSWGWLSAPTLVCLIGGWRLFWMCWLKRTDSATYRGEQSVRSTPVGEAEPQHSGWGLPPEPPARTSSRTASSRGVWRRSRRLPRIPLPRTTPRGWRGARSPLFSAPPVRP